MKKTNKLQITLIIITFLIAIFFLGKWIISVIPKYEWREEIDYCTSGTLSTLENDLYATSWHLKTNYYNCLWFGYEKKYDYCDEFKLTDNQKDPIHKIEACYIKYKERIN